MQPWRGSVRSLAFFLLLIPAGLVSAEDARDKLHQPDRVMDAVGVLPGMIIGEVGAGGGYFTFHLARRVGKSGKIYANDISGRALRSLTEKADRLGVANIETVTGTIRNPKLPAGLDMVFIVNAFHDLEDPVPLLNNLCGSLKPGARVVIVDRDPAKTLDPTHHFMTRDEVAAVVDRSAFDLVRTENFLTNHGIYILAPAGEAGPLVTAKVIRRYLDSIGGEEALRKVDGLIIQGRRMASGGLKPTVLFPWTIHHKREVGFRIERRFEQRVEIDVYTREAAWRFDTAGAPPRRLTDVPRNREFAAFFLDIEGPFLNFEQKGIRFEDIARETVAGKAFHHLEMDLGGGEKLDVYFDAATGLLTERRVEGRAIAYSDYRRVGPLLYPHRIEVRLPGRGRPRVDVIDRVQINPRLPGRLFETPDLLRRKDHAYQEEPDRASSARMSL